jgi:hypothetical protein
MIRRRVAATAAGNPSCVSAIAGRAVQPGGGMIVLVVAMVVATLVVEPTDVADVDADEVDGLVAVNDVVVV